MQAEDARWSRRQDQVADDRGHCQRCVCGAFLPSLRVSAFVADEQQSSLVASGSLWLLPSSHRVFGSILLPIVHRVLPAPLGTLAQIPAAAASSFSAYYDPSYNTINFPAGIIQVCNHTQLFVWQLLSVNPLFHDCALLPKA